MYVCLCNSVTESDIRRAVNEGGVRHFQALKDLTDCSSNCGSCEETAREVLSEALHEQRVFLRVVSAHAA